MRVLFIARYRDESMTYKLDYMVRDRNVILQHITPQFWQDELIKISQPKDDNLAKPYKTTPIALLGKPNDPHRTIYKTLTFNLLQFKPDIIHAEEEPDSLAALQICIAKNSFAPKAKLILNTWQNINRPKKYSVKLVLDATLQMANAVLCANQEAISVLNEQKFKGKTAVIPAVGVDSRIFYASKSTQAQSTPNFVIGYVGRLIKDKGLFDLLQAFNQICTPHLYLRLIGDGNDRDALVHMAQSLPCSAQIEFLPPSPPNQIAHQIRSLNVLVLPSKTTPVWKEQFGRVITEAMACGVPVIGSNSGAIPEVIDNAGLIFPEGDINALTAALHKISQSPMLAQTLSQQGIQRVQQHFSQEVIAAKTLDFYHQLML